MRWIDLLCVAVLLTVTACGTPDEGNAPVAPAEIDSVAQELNGFWYYIWGCAGDCNDLDIGTSTNRTCFLTGIHGNLGPTSHARVEIRSDGHYWLDVYSNPPHPLSAYVTCVPTSSGRTGEYFVFGNNSRSIPYGSTRRCFLTSIFTNPAPANAFSRIDDYALVSQNPFTGAWTLTNSQSPDPYASAWIGATCVNIPTYVTSHYYHSASGLDYTLIDPQIDEACGMNGLGARFIENDYSTGAGAEYLFQYDRWDAILKSTQNSHKKLWLACYR